MKLMCALDETNKYQYQLFDEAVKWATENKLHLMAIANPKDGQNQTYYLCSSVHLLESLEKQWNCNTTRALYTAVVSFLKYKESEFKNANPKLVESFS